MKRSSKQSKLLLHIGPHKTGTSAIQMALQSSSKELTRKNIIFDSLESYEGHNSHQIADMLSTSRKSSAQKTLEKFNECGQLCVVSSENFSRLTLDDVKFLRENLKFSDVRVVYFLRNPLARIKSDWQELVKHGYRFTFLEFIAGRLSRPINDRILNDEVRIAPWREVFGADKIDIHLYDNIEDVVSYFFAYYFKIKKDNNQDRVNASLDLESVEALRALMGLQKVFLGKPNIFTDDLRGIVKSLKLITESQGNKYRKSFPVSLDSFLLRALEKTLLQQNSISIINGNNPNFLFTKRSENYKFISSDIWLEHPDLTNALFDLRAKIIEEYGHPQIDQRLIQV